RIHREARRRLRLSLRRRGKLYADPSVSSFVDDLRRSPSSTSPPLRVHREARRRLRLSLRRRGKLYADPSVSSFVDDLRRSPSSTSLPFGFTVRLDEGYD